MIIECPNCKNKVSDIVTGNCPHCNFDVGAWVIEEERRKKAESRVLDPAKKFHGTITGGYVSFDTNSDNKLYRQEKKRIKAEARREARREARERSERSLQTLLLLDIALGIRDRKRK